MKKILLGFLMLIMLTPALACAMPRCADRQVQSGGDVHPCAAHHADAKTGKQTDKVRLRIDCMGVDLQSASTQADVQKPYPATQDIAYVTADQASVSHAVVTRSSIRGPPPDAIAHPDSSPPILLATQRFRL